jgi:dihydrofolate synthase/folylpolyglutamate synthase
VILDAAHNPASIEALLAVLAERFAERRKIVIFASSKDKDYAGMLRLLVPACDTLLLTQYVENPRATDPETLAAIVQRLRGSIPPSADGSPYGHSEAKPFVQNDTIQDYTGRPALHTMGRPAEAWRLACALAASDDLICITGSFFLAAELRPIVQAASAASVAGAVGK